MSPNVRAPGVVVTSVAVDADLLTRAKTKAAEADTTVSEVIRAALREYVEDR